MLTRPSSYHLGLGIRHLHNSTTQRWSGVRGGSNLDGSHAFDDCSPANGINKARYNSDIAMLDVVPVVSFTHVRFFSKS
jgi:hypothetical protein